MRRLARSSLIGPVVAFVLLGMLSYAVVPHNRVAHGYSFDWPTQPYLRDSYGNYSYRDMQFTFYGCGSGWCWFKDVGSYVHFVADPSSGYHYDSWGFLIAGSQAAVPNDWEWGSLYLHHGNTPFTKWGTRNVDMLLRTDVRVSQCQTSNCASVYNHVSYGSNLSAYVPAGSTTGNCYYKRLPLEYYC